jgi:hypothetical protein
LLQPKKVTGPLPQFPLNTKNCIPSPVKVLVTFTLKVAEVADATNFIKLLLSILAIQLAPSNSGQKTVGL